MSPRPPEPRKRRGALRSATLAVLVAGSLAGTGLLVAANMPRARGLPFGVLAASAAPARMTAPAGELADAEPECDAARPLALPTGDAPALSCDQARRVVAQARGMLATPAPAVDPKRFVGATSDWLDPHGMWSVAPDAPIQAALTAVGPTLVAELEEPAGAGPCLAAEEVGGALSRWVGELRREVLRARTLGRGVPIDPKRRWDIASSTPFEDGSVTRRGHDLARLLGHGVGAIESAYGPAITPLSDTLVERAAPELSAHEWSQIVLAAAVRAYVPQLDPHGAWAPLDEETSIYDLDLEVDPPPRLWSEMTRTTLGVRVDDGARAPLKDGDVVLRVGATALAGMSVEQANQLSIVSEPDPLQVTVLRASASQPLVLEVGPELTFLSPPPSATELIGLDAKEVRFGDGYALVVKIPDVPDDLGARLTSALFERKQAARPLGVLLDLRGNGGGSTEGALAALGVFLPGAALFPMRRRDGAVEIDRAPVPPPERIWDGPVAALVDGDSASAAEMLAGALASYDRGVVLGARTYGKGCAQEYLDDDVGVGVLRLTTLVFSLPDGSPLQRVGVSPHVTLGLPAALDAESHLTHAPTTWRGPDVRDAHLIKKVPWPDNSGRVGVSDDEAIYRALRALGATRKAAR
ncbi:MAG: hypothetical protein IPM79_35240 [Polyangiaceae bacterium]|nr:hypothetical protein [Polyangiaceae bacterium]MBK8942713.1 hypothetical protein [Polyangiaceae bacterium]